MDPAVFRETLSGADLVLDTPGWSGCNTLLDALSFALPIVTLPGATMRSRHGAAILAACGEREGICDNADDYVRLAVRWGLDPSARRAVSEKLRTGLPKLATTEAVRALERHLLACCRATPS